MHTLERRVARHNPSAVMIGRQAVRTPWIFAAARGLQPKVDRLELSLRFLELLRRYQPPAFHLTRAKRFYQYHTQALRWGAQLFTRLKRADSIAEIEEEVRAYFDAHPRERYPSR